MLQLKNISKDFGTKSILNNISEVIYDGEKIGIVGNNGQGKSTLLEILTKQINPDCGEVIVDCSFAVLKQNFVFEKEKLCNLLQDKNFAQEFLKWLKKFNVQAEFDFQNFDKLSCGEKTKLALSAVFAQKTDCLILDEPTNHLDMEAKLLLVKNINDFSGTVLIVSHDKDFFKSNCSKNLGT